MKLAHINTALFVAIMVVVGYIVIAPIIPIVSFWFEAHTTPRMGQLRSQLHIPISQLHIPPTGDRLIIPVMMLDAPINEGRDLSALRTGTWRRPNTSTPDKGGNTVIVGHRFTYVDPKGIFYYLNKLQVGDEVGVFWHGTRYVYKVFDVQVVPPTTMNVEAPTSDARLTLYTCTPTWWPKNRLIVSAKLEQQ